MDVAAGFGLAAAVLTTIAFFPQVIKTWRTHSTRDISLGMFLILTTGVACWVVYAILTRDVWVFLGNAVILCLAGTILVFKLRYK